MIIFDPFWYPAEFQGNPKNLVTGVQKTAFISSRDEFSKNSHTVAF